MKGLIYIAGAFSTVVRSQCGGGAGWIDGDPHFWTSPPTWGICRNDLRRKAEVGDYVFFVLPKAAEHPQTILGYMRVAEKISHVEAYARRELRSKWMGNKNPNGNILVDGRGRYNKFDGGVHRGIFDNVKREYIVGDPSGSRFFNAAEIEATAPSFLPNLRGVLGKKGERAVDLISRYGRELSEKQVGELLKWLSSG